MSNFPTNIPVSIKTGAVSINSNVITYQTVHGGIKFNMTRNPVQVLDGEMRQALMQSLDGDWFLETNSGGIRFLFIRLFHQTYLMKLPSNHELIPSN